QNDAVRGDELAAQLDAERQKVSELTAQLEEERRKVQDLTAELKAAKKADKKEK
ncbi:hypothetical protein RS206_005398, partial [Escherichia coli]|nr:hypothetical protein [Escherichia coli]